MERRTYLGSLGAAGLAGIAGCLETLGLRDDSQTALEPAEDHPDDPPYPSHGDEFPSFSIPDPVAGTTVSRDDFVGERAFLLTYFFTSCPDGVCPALLTRLQWVQEDAAERGYSDDVALLGFTFDPERDTAEELKEHAEGQHLDYEADNFHFLRPESYEEAETLMNDTFGMALERVEDGDEGAGNDTAEDGHDTDGNETDHDDHDHGEYTFTHNGRITLVNEDGIVERAYPKAVQSDMAVTKDRLLEETRTVVGVE